MGGAADVPQRSSSPLKRPASDLEVDGKDDVDMITVPTPGLIEPSNTSKSSPLANRAQSVDMLGADEADVSNDNTNLRRKSQEIPPIDHQIQTVTTIVEANEQVPIKDGDKLYLVSLRWLNRVKARGSAAKQNSKEEPEGEIGPIDNSDIIQQIGKDSDGKDYVQLKPGIGSESFLAVPEDAWDLIVSWYGLMPGSIPIVRTAHNTNPDKWALPNVIYEWHPLVIVVHRLWSHNNPLALPADLKRLDPTAPIFVLSRTTKYHDFLKLIKTKAAIDLTRKVRVWRVPRIQPASESVAPVGSAATPPSSRPASPAAENISVSTSKAPQDSWTKLLLDVESFTKLESGVEREKLDLADNTNNKNYNGNMDLATAGLGEDQTIVLDEFVSQDMYVCNYIPKQDKSASIVVTKSGKKANNQTNSGRNSPAPIGPVTRGRTQRSGKTVGCVGLSNLGNTCYMNSALQCVRSVEELTKYFLSKTSEEELNTDNPLGNNGEVAIMYGQLLQEMYKDPVPGSITPRYFKNTIGKYAPSFSGYGQQDSQEFLGFLLDGLQEDLSRVKKKPYIEKPDSTDEMVNNEELIREMAAKVWDITKKRDDSVIADLFTGMYKSTLVCPECNKVSITFDPFNNLTLQLPIENIWRHDIIYFPLSDSPIRISVDLDKNGSIKALKQFVSERVNVPVERLFCAENWKEKFYKVHDDMKCASEEIGQNDNCNVYELEAVPTNWPAPKKQPKKGKTKTIYSSNLDSSDDDVPNWDSPLAERMIVPVYHRTINNDRGRNNRTKAHKWTLAPHVITLTPQEARSEDMVRRKILEKVATFTTYSFVTNDTDSSSPESASESVDPDLVVTTGSDADSAGDGKVVAHSIDGEDGLVDVSMKNSTNTPESSDVNDKKAVAQTPKSVEHKFNTRRPPYLDPKVFLEPEVQNMFDLSYYTGVNELVPLGWQSVQEEKTYPLLSSRNPQLQQPIHEADDYDMTNGRGSETSDDDTLSSNNAISNTRMTEESDDSEDELAKNFNRPLPDRPKAPRSGFKVGFGNKRRSRLKTYSKKGNKPPPKLPHSEAFDQDAPDDGPLVRLGEGIIVDWKQDAFETIFCADDPQDTLRGQSKLEAVNIPLLPDENLAVKRKTRLARRKNGITLDDCLDEFGKEEILSEQDTWYCPRCKEHRRASKKFELWKIPDILVMHLKRFSSSGIRRDKLDVLVDFPIEGLDLSSRVIEHEDGKSEIYDLFAVDDHWGGLGGGHYTAFAKNFNDDQWYEYNDSSVSKVADPQRVVSPSAYLLFYRRRSEVPLGGPRLKAIVESFDSPNDSSDDETSDSGEGQGLVGNSSLHGSSRALTGAGAVHPLQNPGSSGKEMTTINPQDLDELPPYENQDLNDGMQLQNSIEEDEGISMNDNTITAFTANWSGWSTMPGLGTDNPERPSGAGSDMDVQSDGDFSNRSDIVQDNSSCGSAVRADRVIDFEDTPAVDDNGDNWVDQSLVPDIDDGRVDMYDFQHTLQLSKHSVPLQQFNVPAAGPEIEEEVDEPATDIHVEEGEGLKIE